MRLSSICFGTSDGGKFLKGKRKGPEYESGQGILVRGTLSRAAVRKIKR
jgi:hypothetical protein